MYISGHMTAMSPSLHHTPVSCQLKKKKQNLEVENDVLFSGLAEDLSQETASRIALRGSSEEVREEPGYILIGV